jgi:hypothetical protein
VRPDTKSYNTVINAWAKSGEMEAVSRAEHTLAEMTRRSEAGEHHLKPDTILFLLPYSTSPTTIHSNVRNNNKQTKKCRLRQRKQHRGPQWRIKSFIRVDHSCSRIVLNKAKQNRHHDAYTLLPRCRFLQDIVIHLHQWHLPNAIKLQSSAKSIFLLYCSFLCCCLSDYSLL